MGLPWDSWEAENAEILAELVSELTFPVKYEFEQEANLGKVHVD